MWSEAGGVSKDRLPRIVSCGREPCLSYERNRKILTDFRDPGSVVISCQKGRLARAAGRLEVCWGKWVDVSGSCGLREV